MKILVVCGAGYVSGKEIIALHLLKGLRERGVDVSCVISSWSNGDFERRLVDSNIPHYKIRIGFISKTFDWSAIRMTLIQLWYMPFLYFRYQRVLRKFNPDIVIHSNFHHLFILLPVLGSAKQVYWSHEIITNSKFYKSLFERFAKRIDVFIGVSEAVSQSIRTILGASQIATIRNGVPLPLSTARHSDDPCEITLGIVGQVAPHKGHEVLFSALQNYRTFPRPVSLHVIGTGDPIFMASLKKLAADLKISHLIRWRGFIQDVEEIYQGIDCLIVPTVRPEPLGLIIMEGGLRGIPSIASDSGGITELIKDCYNGFLFKTGEVRDLSSKIQEMLTSDLPALKKNCEYYARLNFLEKKFLTDFNDLLVTLCKH